MIDVADIGLLEATLLQFSEHVRQGAEREGEGSGDEIARLLDDLREMGVVAEPQTVISNDDLAVWGGHVIRQGCDLSLTALTALARGSADLAAMVHAQGVGCLALDGRGDLAAAASSSAVAAVFTPEYGVLLDERTIPEGVRFVEGAHPHLLGSSPVVTAMGDPQHVIVFARHDRPDDPGGRLQWETVVVRTDAPGVRIHEVGPRVGLRATPQFEVSFNRVDVEERAVIASGERAARLAVRVCAADWLGSAAIALGTARHALRQARTYAAERYQAGRQISGHAAVQLLLGEAHHDLDLMDGVLRWRAGEPLETISDGDLLEWAITSRLSIGEHVHRAVNNAIQVHGGYGYMDDYGVSGRARDVSALAARHGSREQLLLLLERSRASIGRES